MLRPIDFIAGLAKALLQVLAGFGVVFDQQNAQGVAPSTEARWA
ncbi:hypothetical protein QN386_24315 [Pseudomonas sp. CCI3.2]|nr:hypothetical protein [Pseudomonas sp. CCI3.2]MEB0104431.1 hypothetical protein [Pseudomonas sp. CCI3.2]